MYMKPAKYDRMGWTYWLHGTIEHEHELAVEYVYREWSESHPYGSTVAYERCAEVEDVIGYELDGDEVSYDFLVHRFGKEFIDAKIEETFPH
jgi:hypothetical protein